MRQRAPEANTRRNEQLEVPHQRVPFRLLRLQRWSHFKAKPPSHAPSGSGEANPGAATPRATRGRDANGRAGDG
ncbi:hypothetical protein AB1E18_016277 [Capra hircus]